MALRLTWFAPSGMPTYRNQCFTLTPTRTVTVARDTSWNCTRHSMAYLTHAPLVRYKRLYAEFLKTCGFSCTHCDHSRSVDHRERMQPSSHLMRARRRRDAIQAAPTFITRSSNCSATHYLRCSRQLWMGSAPSSQASPTAARPLGPSTCTKPSISAISSPPST